jgi:maleylacetate reductase
MDGPSAPPGAGVFRYTQPPTIRWGAGSVAELGGELDRLGVDRPFLVTTRSLADNAGSSRRLREAAGRELVGAWSAIRQHAPEADVRAATDAAAAARPTGIVSFGGGSAIDAAKIVALEVGCRGGGDRPLPHVAIPTTLSVAELAPSAGVTDAAGQKGGRRDPRLVPAAVIYDAELALATPLDLWLSTGIRALDHGVETILEPGQHPYADTLALEGIRRLFRSLPEAKARPDAVEPRTSNQLGAWFAYGLASAAQGLSHVLGKQIGSPHGIPHGVTSCLLLPHVMRYRARTQAARLALMAPAMGVGGRGRSEAELAQAAADAVADLIARLGQPRHLADYGLTEDQLRAAALPISGPTYPLDDLLAIYRAAA